MLLICKTALGGGGREGKAAISQFCPCTFCLPYLNLLEEKVFTKVTSSSLTFLGALCGGGGFLLAEKVFLSLEIGACLEWQGAEMGCLSWFMQSLILWCLLCCVLQFAGYIAYKNPQNRKAVVCCRAYELNRLLKSSCARKVGTGEGDVWNGWKKMTGNEKYTTLGVMEVMEVTQWHGLFRWGCCLPVRGDVGPHQIHSQPIATAGIFSTGYSSSLKTLRLHRLVRVR